jgi:hypothetical protein
MQHRFVLTFAGLNEKSVREVPAVAADYVPSKVQRAPFFRSLLVILSLFALLASALVFCRDAFCAQVSLVWDPVGASSLAGYKLYYGTVSRNYSSAVDAGTQTTATVTGLNEGATYYFAATAYDTAGIESASSNEVAYTIPSSCSHSIAPTGNSFTAAAGTGSVSVTTQNSCSWTAANSASWITITPGASGMGNGTVNYSASANTASSSRTAGLTIAGAVFTVTQAGTSAYTIASSAGANGTISPSGQVTVNQGGSRSFAITPASGYKVAAVVVDGASVGALTSYTFTNVTANHTISAGFSGTSTSYTLTISKAGTGSGTISTNPNGTVFPSGTKVTLTATPGRRSVFSGWYGACSGTSRTCTITMNSNASVTGSFGLRWGH